MENSRVDYTGYPRGISEPTHRVFSPFRISRESAPGYGRHVGIISRVVFIHQWKRVVQRWLLRNVDQHKRLRFHSFGRRIIYTCATVKARVQYVRGVDETPIFAFNATLHARYRRPSNSSRWTAFDRPNRNASSAYRRVRRQTWFQRIRHYWQAKPRSS